MFGRKNKINKIEYNPEVEKLVIISSICTGEQRAGLKDIRTGHFKEIMLINNQKDLDTFKKMCDVQDVEVEY